ncbi:MAG: leucine-rich repeat protein [Clostridia bacterium]|nr:leucine-rich repeat protein [Clostridia bacterium]
MKKTILIVLVVVLLLVFAGCGATTYKVTFDTDGGSAVETQTVKEGEKAVRPANPAKDGFVFDNWYTAETGGEIFDFDAAVTGNVTVYARWNSTSAQTVSFKVNYVAAEGLDTSFNKSETVTLAVGADLPAPSYDYLQARGYYTDRSMNTVFSGTKVTEDMPEIWVRLDRKLSITQGKFVYTLNEDDTTYAVSENPSDRNTESVVTLPSNIGPYDVTAVAGRGFSSSSIEKLIIPEGYTEISENGFYGNSALAVVYFPSTLTTIGDTAFLNARSLKVVNFSEGLKRIGESAFSGTSLSYVVLPATLEEIGSDAFDIAQPDEDTKVLKEVLFMGNDVPAMDSNAFGSVRRDYFCYPEAEEAYKAAFSAAGAAGSLYYHDENRLAYMGEYAPADGETFGTKLWLSGSYTGVVETIDGYEVVEMSELNTFYYIGSALGDRRVAILDNEQLTFVMHAADSDGFIIVGNILYDYVGSAEVLYIPENVTEVSADAVQGLITLKMVIFGDDVTTVGERAFSGCPYLVSIVFGMNIDYIGDQAFSIATYLIDVHFPNAERVPSYIGQGAFYRLEGLGLIPSTTEWGGLMTVYVGGTMMSNAGPFEYMAAFNAHNKTQEQDGEDQDGKPIYKEVNAYGDYADFVPIGAEAGEDRKGKVYDMADGSRIYLSGGDSAILFLSENGTEKQIWGAYRFDDYEQITIRAGFTVNGTYVYYFGKPDGDDFLIRDDVFGTYNDGSLTVTLDGYGAASFVDENGLKNGAYSVSGTEITFVGIDGLTSAAFTAASDEVSARLSLTYGGTAHTLSYTGKEVGVYHDLINGGRIELDGKGTANIYYLHESYERSYILDGSKLKITWQAAEDGADPLVWEWTYSSTSRTISGYWNAHASDYYYNVNFKFGIQAIGAEEGAYTDSQGNSLTLDGYFVAAYTRAGGSEEKFNYFMFAQNSVLVYFADDYKLIVLSGTSFTQTQVSDESVAGRYYAAGSNYNVWLDGNGRAIYSNGMKVWDYEIDGTVFKLTSYDGETPYTHETGVNALDTDGYIETAFYSWGYNYLRLFKNVSESLTISSFKLNGTSYYITVCDNGFVFGYKYGEAISIKGSVADFAAAKEGITAKTSFDVVIDGTEYTATYSADDWEWNVTPKA